MSLKNDTMSELHAHWFPNLEAFVLLDKRTAKVVWHLARSFYF